MVAPENISTIFFSPQPHLKMMMDRRHLEQALAAGNLEVCYLQDDRQRFDNIDQPDQQQDQRHIAGKRQTCHRAAKKQRARVPMKTLAGLKL